MTYSIFGYQIKKPSNELITIDDSITEEEFERIVLEKETCLISLQLEEKLNLLLDNAYEFEVEMLKLAQAFLMRPQRVHEDAMRERLLLDRRIVNLLSSCRLYLDQSEHAISALFGGNSEELSRIRASKNKSYDEVFGYRLMEALRNHVQHRGLLAHIISYHTEGLSKENPEWDQYTVSPRLNVAELNADPKFKRSILEELKTIGKEIDLRLPMREYISAIVQIHNEIRRMITSTFSQRFDSYRGAVLRYKERDGISIIGAMAVEKDLQGERLREYPLVGEFLDYFDMLSQKNSNLRNLRKSIASNSAA